MKNVEKVSLNLQELRSGEFCDTSTTALPTQQTTSEKDLKNSPQDKTPVQPDV
jgi:hypothetical protein